MSNISVEHSVEVPRQDEVFTVTADDFHCTLFGKLPSYTGTQHFSEVFWYLAAIVCCSL